MRKVRSASDAASSRSAKHETVFANHKSYIVDVKDTLPARGYVFRVRGITARLKVPGPNHRKKQAHRRAAHCQKLLVHPEYKLWDGASL